MRSSRGAVIIVYGILVVLALTCSAVAATWELSGDWSGQNNPNGAWTYGRSSTVGGNLTPYIRVTNPPAGQEVWSGTSDENQSGLYGSIRKTLSDGSVELRHGVSDPYYQVVARWTSPVSGSVHVWGRFSWSMNSSNRQGRAYILHNGVQKYSAITGNWNTAYVWDGDVTVAAGDTIDFVCATDPNYQTNQNFITTSAVITTDPVGTVNGVVREGSTGHFPVPHAVVKTFDGKFVVAAGSDGSYSLRLPQGTYSLTASGPNLLSRQHDGVTVAGGGSINLNFDLEGATVAGNVTSEATGAPIVGATVRTFGEASYVTTTGTDGGYTLLIPGGSFTLLAASGGSQPQRKAISVTAGNSSVCNFALRSPAAGSFLTFPAPLDWGEPPGAPTAPGDSFPVAFTDTAAVPAAGSPRIGGWHETLKPDESFTLTGSAFTTRSGADAGTDTTVWMWARTSAGGGVMKQARIWKVTAEMLVATLPDDIPYGMYLVWVENGEGISAPVCINKIRTTFVGPTGNIGWAGAVMRVFGKNMSRNRGSVASASSVYIQPAGGGAFVPCTVSRVDPYSVEFTVPAGTLNGSYKVFVHNGHGGAYGWSDPLDLVVTNQWVRGSYEYPLSPTGGDDTASIQTAINVVGVQLNGGTVRLSAGTFKVTSGLSLPANVEIRGAGPDLTTIEIRVSAGVRAFSLQGSRIALTDLTTYEPNGPMNGWNGLINAPWPIESAYNKFSNVRFTGAPSTGVVWLGKYSEAVNCTFYTTVGTTGECWIHNCSSLGSRYRDGWEAAYHLMYKRDVLEYNHIETPNWPYDPSKPKPYNYGENLTSAEYGELPWNKRIALIYCSDLYLANNTSKDVAATDPLWQSNTGEMLLAHAYPGQWFGNVLSASGKTVALRTDGLVNDQVVTVNNYTVTYIAGMYPLTGGGPVPDGYQYSGQTYYSPLDGAESIYGITIIGGKGMGQFRRIVSHTPQSVTVDSPWLVQPDATSIAMIARHYVDNTIYKNELNAYPQGFVQSYSASIGVAIDGHGWRTSIEGNTSRRTCQARQLSSGTGSAACWNEFRDEKGYDVFGTYHPGIDFFTLDGEPNPAGLTSIGNVIRGGEFAVVGNADRGTIRSFYTAGCIFEGITLSGKQGFSLNGFGGLPKYGAVLARKNAVTVYDSPTLLPVSPEPVKIVVHDEGQMFNRNVYAGTYPQLYVGSPYYDNPIPLQRCARFKGYVGGHLDPVMIPIGNTGIQAMNWTVTSSDSWITAEVGASPTVAAEGDSGKLIVSVDNSGMGAGVHWGYVTLSSGSKTFKVGVCVDIAAGSPAQFPPIASMTASPHGGIVPVTAAFDAGASIDPDGVIVSYSWDFGDGTGATGVTANRTYSTAGVYLVTLTVTDNSGNTGVAMTPITVGNPLTGVNVTGSPVPPVSPGTKISLTATAIGGYDVRYKFLLRSGNTWSTLREYSTSQNAEWTPSANGAYSIRVLARSADSANQYDAMGEISYPVGLLPSSGLKLWLRADTGVEVDESGNVMRWIDQSGLGNSVSQDEGLKRPDFVQSVFEGKPVVRFGSAGQILKSNGLVLSGTTPFTAFTVAKFNSVPVGAWQYLWWNGGTSITEGYGCYISTAYKLRYAWGGQSYYLGDANAVVIGDWYKISSRYSPGSHQVWLNGVARGTSAKTDSNLGSGFFSVGNFGPDTTNKVFYGDVGEILIYDRALTDEEMAAVESYIQTKWSSVTAVTRETLKEVKDLPDQTIVSIIAPKTVTAASGVFTGGIYYIAEPARTQGLKVVGGPSVSLWENLTLSGTVGTDSNGEKVLGLKSIDSRVPGTELGTLGMQNKWVASTGQLVRVWGKVTQVGSGYFILDDGSGSPVRVETSGLVTPITVTVGTGNYASATGIAAKGSGGVTVVRPRVDSDIRVY